VITSPYLTDSQVDEICAGLTQPAAKIRYLRSLGLRVHRKPNGRPLVWLPEVLLPDAGHNAQPAGGINVVGLRQWATRRAARTKGSSDGQKTQGR